MSLTAVQKSKIKAYLGFPVSFQNENPRLNGALDLVNDATLESLIATAITNIEAVFTALADVSRAGVQEADEVKLTKSDFGASTYDKQLRANGRMWVNQLSCFLGCPIVGDIFSEQGYPGDYWFHGSADPRFKLCL